jgi:hypothetical protein
VSWLEQAEDRLDTVLTLWQARLLARRGEYGAARALLERPGVAEDRRGQDEILEGWCELLSEEGAWDEARVLAIRAAQHADRAGVPPLALYATRLEGRAAAGTEEIDRAVELLGAAADGFAELGAVWEAAVSRLDLAAVLLPAGRSYDASTLAGGAAQVFDRLGSVRELSRARDLLGQPA